MPVPLLHSSRDSFKSASPTRVYELDLSEAESFSCSEQPRCQFTTRFRWKLDELPGIWSLLCTRLGDNPCADYALNYQVRDVSAASAPDGDELTEVCHPGVIHTGNVSASQVLQVTLWYVTASIPDVKCYAWVTPDGRIPVSPQAEAHHDDLISKLVVRQVSSLLSST